MSLQLWDIHVSFAGKKASAVGLRNYCWPLATDGLCDLGWPSASTSLAVLAVAFRTCNQPPDGGKFEGQKRIGRLTATALRHENGSQSCRLDCTFHTPNVYAIYIEQVKIRHFHSILRLCSHYKIIDSVKIKKSNTRTIIMTKTRTGTKLSAEGTELLQARHKRF